MADHADVMDAAGFWRQFVVPFYFDQPGDEVAGALLSYRMEGPRGDEVPSIRLQTPDGRVFEVTAHQERLKAALVRHAPRRGDRVRIVFTGEADRSAPGMSKAKLFAVEVTRAGDSPGPASPGDGGGDNGRPCGGTPDDRPPATTGEAELTSARVELSERRSALPAAGRTGFDVWLARLRFPPIEGMSLGQLQRALVEVAKYEQS